MSEPVIKCSRFDGMLCAERIAAYIVIGFLITAAQVLFAMYWARHDTPELLLKYLSLWQHDSQWYGHILKHGYRVNRFPFEAPGNNMAHVGFFPGYPLLSYLLKTVIRLDTRTAMLVTSQLFTVGMWTYLLMFFRRLQVRLMLQAAAIAVIVCFPSGFFLIAAYSESLFIFTLLGYLYWTTRGTPHSWFVAAGHGFVMSATRIVGAPLVVIPVLWNVLEHRSVLKVDRKTVVVSVCTLLGTALFFLYCQATLGQWNAYSRAQAIGWGVLPNYKAMFDLNIYRMYWPPVSWDGFVGPDDISRISIPTILSLFGALLVCELVCSLRRTRTRDQHLRLLCYASTVCLLFITISGLWSRRMISVIRYMLPVVVILSICAVSLLSQGDVIKSPWLRRVLVALFACMLAVFSFVQAGHIDLFSFGAWVA